MLKLLCFPSKAKSANNTGNGKAVFSIKLSIAFSIFNTSSHPALP